MSYSGEVAGVNLPLTVASSVHSGPRCKRTVFGFGAESAIPCAATLAAYGVLTPERADELASVCVDEQAVLPFTPRSHSLQVTSAGL